MVYMLFCGMGYLEMDSTINGVSVGYSTHTDDSHTLAYLSNYEAHPRQERSCRGLFVGNAIN